MKRTTGMKSRREPVKAATRPLLRVRFHAFLQFREITVLAKPENSELP
jgi:hypothetical protein